MSEKKGKRRKESAVCDGVKPEEGERRELAQRLAELDGPPVREPPPLQDIRRDPMAILRAQQSTLHESRPGVYPRDGRTSSSRPPSPRAATFAPFSCLPSTDACSV